MLVTGALIFPAAQASRSVGLDQNRLFFIGDECHHHGGAGFVGKLLPGARFRLGLSATPFHYMDDDANNRLKAVYDKPVFEYGLADFARNSLYPSSSVGPLLPWLRRYDLEHLAA